MLILSRFERLSGNSKSQCIQNFPVKFMHYIMTILSIKCNSSNIKKVSKFCVNSALCPKTVNNYAFGFLTYPCKTLMHDTMTILRYIK